MVATRWRRRFRRIRAPRRVLYDYWEASRTLRVPPQKRSIASMATGATLCCRIFTIFNPTLPRPPMSFLTHQAGICQQCWQHCGDDGIEPRPVSLMHVHVYRAPLPREEILILTFPLTGWRSKLVPEWENFHFSVDSLSRNRCYLKVNYTSIYSIFVLQFSDTV